MVSSRSQPHASFDFCRVWRVVSLGRWIGVAKHAKQAEFRAGATCWESVHHFCESGPRLPQAGIQDVCRGDWDLCRVGLPDVVNMKRNGISQDPLEVLVIRNHEQFGLATRGDGFGNTFDRVVDHDIPVGEMQIVEVVAQGEDLGISTLVVDLARIGM